MTTLVIVIMWGASMTIWLNGRLNVVDVIAAVLAISGTYFALEWNSRA